MGFSVNSNLEAFNAHRRLSMNSVKLARSMQRLSSGLRINSAADDAAGLGVAERLRGQVQSLQVAQRNVQQGMSLLQTAEGGINEIHSIVHRIRDLAVQYNGGTLSNAEKAAITTEVQQLSLEVGRIIERSKFGNIQLLGNGTAGTLVTLQIGNENADQLAVAAPNLLASIGADIANFAGATDPTLTANVDALNALVDRMSSKLAAIAAYENRLEHASSWISVQQENMASAESHVRDVDMAQEISNLTRLQIMQQSGTAMLAQANLNPQTLMRLFG